jgi:hypothetical protein
VVIASGFTRTLRRKRVKIFFYPNCIQKSKKKEIKM